MKKRSYCGLLLAFWLLGVQAEQRFEVNFENTEIDLFIESVGRITGTNFVIDPRVRGTLTVRSAQPLAADDVYALALAQLRANGYAAVELDDGSVKILPDQAARTEPLPVEVDDGAPAKPGAGDTVATRVFAVRGGNLEQLLGIVRPLMDTRVGVATPYPASNLLVVTDWRSNLSRIGQLLARLDRGRDEPVEMIALRHAQARDTAPLVERLLASRGQAGGGVQVLADARSNALMVRGDEAVRRQVRRLVAELDVSRDAASDTEVVYLHHAKAGEVVKVLRGLSGEVTQEARVEIPVAAAPVGNTTPMESDGEGAISSAKAGGGALATGAPGIRLEADLGTNAIVLIGPPRELAAYKRIIQQLDIRRAQVVVEAIIAEITDTKANQLGVQWLFLDRNGNLPAGSVNFTNGTPINGIAAAAANQDTTALGSLLSGMQGISAGVGRLGGSGLNFVTLLQAMRSESGFNLLSTPTLLTLDNAEASIMVGQEVPFVTGSVTSNNANPYQTIERREVGVKLRLKPQINEGDTVRMEIVQEVSSLADNVRASDVVTNKREIKTTVMVEDNGLIVLGGLISNEGTDSDQRVPLLGDVPVLGNLFKSRTRSSTKQNLVVFIRPRILRDPGLVQQISEDKYRGMRAAAPAAALPATPPGTRGAPTLQSLYPSARARLDGL
ncbi:type II secretion system secretin GspD [Pseudomonas oryzihabitans]|uniref:type II secretion system secretin GspD n=1 Tax=Pseudomonas oryzihabitans TaxID=47885 RepID=UPI002894ABF3|nr:type II secretion system secretin GspD [Pseudomonas oryzihabitans]MDT3721851.1 type II secretion system secretin GspD [Pseudomonas oryzihabitans]